MPNLQIIVVDVRRDDVTRDQIADVVRQMMDVKHLQILITPPGIDVKVIEVGMEVNDDLPTIVLKKDDEVYKIVMESSDEEESDGDPVPDSA